MKKYIFILFLLPLENCFSQAGMWTWISGDSTANASGVYGTQGIPSVNNHPPCAYEDAEWKDKQGNFWIYGGVWPDEDDLWKYNPGTNEWTWVKGNGVGSQGTVYGTQGIPDPANSPGTLSFGAATWVDTTGNLWLFGGGNNDLWKYDISNNEWTWMKGDALPGASGIHGIQGVPSISNVPGSRNETCSAWTDLQNNLWLFGGFGRNDAGAVGFLNDLMKYDIATNEWTWMSGSNSINAASNYGIKGVSSASNIPGGRMSFTKWKDIQNNFWLMGSYNPSYLNDVWKYDASINQWTWISGTNVTDDTGTYLTNCIYDTLAMPSARLEPRSAVTDNCGRFWLFGGSSSGDLNDLWVYDPQSLPPKWNIVYGSNIPNLSNIHGSIGIPSITNRPAARAGAVAWWGNDNKFYLFAGFLNFTWVYSDLWVYTPDSNCIQDCNSLAVAAFNSTNHICPGTCVDFLNLSFNATSFLWFFPGALPDTSTAINPSNVCYVAPGSYDVQLIATNSNGSDTILINDYINVYPQPTPQSITQSGDTLFAIGGSADYQWYFNGNVISGATDYFYVATASGDYNLVATDSNGCEVEAVINNVIASSQFAVPSLQFAIYPNPVGTELKIKNEELKIKTAFTISIYNLLGEMVVNPQTLILKPETSFNVSVLTRGMYWLELSDGNRIKRARFIKE